MMLNIAQAAGLLDQVPLHIYQGEHLGIKNEMLGKKG